VDEKVYVWEGVYLDKSMNPHIRGRLLVYKWGTHIHNVLKLVYFSILTLSILSGHVN